MNRIHAYALVVAFCTCAGTRGTADSNWPQFRGPNGAGLSDVTGLPTRWSADELEWDVQIRGLGHSSPIVWGNALFLTTAVQDGTQRQLLRLDARTGKQDWVRSIGLKAPHLHRKNSWASGTPATDGQHVYVTFADEENYVLAAFDFAGAEVWRHNVGPFSSQHGQGASPIVHGELVILPNDQRGPSTVVALNRHSGKVVWETPRATREASYATPLLFSSRDSAPQLICLSGATGLTSLEPATGQTLWRAGDFPLRTVASPIAAGSLIIASCGSGGVGRLMLAVDARTGVGTDQRIRWQRKTALPYVPTPVAYRGHLYLWTDRGIAVCLDSETGEEVWRQRVGGNFSGSPVCVDGHLYCVSEAGDAFVIEASPEYRLLGKTHLGDPCYATPAVAHGRLYLRTFHRLMCLKARSSEQPGETPE